MNLGHISYHFRPFCQGCDRPNYALPFDGIFVKYHVLALLIILFWFLYHFDNKHTFIVIVNDISCLSLSFVCADLR